MSRSTRRRVGFAAIGAGLVALLLALYPHLSDRLGSGARAEALVRSTDRQTSLDRVEAWIRADSEGAARPIQHETHFAENRASDSRRQETRTAATAPPDGAQSALNFGRK